ncbi:ATP-binding protein [Brachyspira hampsonii]|uniref:ATP-binding protein n=1 Tax=Brachyspira hampsonii TaxID=1287055 RepID=A0A1E5NI02_9SPIR|nr:ATP-binding protein [Brachyspira hampsonii]OEJ15791.1 ATP-binding protein [Brachyspira hampsonii]
MNKTKTSNKKSSSKNNIENIQISNFTVFKNAEINFSKGLNVFIGKNGTGKTHLLKLINCLDINFYNIENKIENIVRNARIKRHLYPFDMNIDKIFSKYSNSKNIENKISNFIQKYLEYKKKKSGSESKIETIFETIDRDINECNIIFNKKINLVLSVLGIKYLVKEKEISNLIPQFEFLINDDELYHFQNNKFTFIPCKDILTSSNGFAALYDKRDINFEAVYYNIIKKTELPKLRELDDDLFEIAKKIENAIGGKTIHKNNNFFIDYKNIGEVSFDMAAEGHKKLALIYILIMNGEIDKNTILLLDEPESNLNPSLTDLLVNILLSLSKLGLQIFIATHNSFILDDIELQKTDKDSVMYHSFYFDENDFNSGVKIESKEILLDLENNPINEKIIKQHNEYIEDMIK